jgi:hypothetical protein
MFDLKLCSIHRAGNVWQERGYLFLKIYTQMDVSRLLNGMLLILAY